MFQVTRWFMFYLRIAIHLSPLLPLACGYHYAAIATALFVALLYIKTLKFKQRLDQIAEVQSTESAAYLDNKKMMTYWGFFTFLPRPSSLKQ